MSQTTAPAPLPSQPSTPSSPLSSALSSTVLSDPTPRDTNPSLPEKAALKRILRFLRGRAYHRSLRNTVKRLQRTGAIDHWDSSVEFKDKARALQRKWIVRDFKHFVTTAIYLIQRDMVKRGLRLTDSEHVGVFNIRKFIAAILIDNRPEGCFETLGRLEARVQDAARLMITTFRGICRIHPTVSWRPEGSQSWAEWRDFLSQLNNYLVCFEIWKVPDEHKLTERVKHGLLALYKAESHLKPGDIDMTKMKQDFHSQKLKLRMKLKQIAGESGVRLFDDFLREQGFIVTEEDLQEYVPESEEENVKVNKDGVSSLPGRMTNEQLAHELLLDPGFKLDAQGAGYVENETLSNIREAFKQSFWASLVDDLRLSVPCYVRVLKVVGEVRDGIIDLVPSRARELREKIDIAYWKEQIDQELIDWPSCVALIDTLLSIEIDMQRGELKQETIRERVRIKEEMEGAATEDQPRIFCVSLQFALDQVNKMRVEAANDRLRSIAFVIQNHGVEYERAHMARKIKKNPLYLRITPSWIRKTVEAETTRSFGMLSKILTGDSQAYKDIHSLAVLRLVASDEPVQTDTCPETLSLDLVRLQHLHNQFNFDKIAACMLAMASQRLRAKGGSPAVDDVLLRIKASIDSFDASRLGKDRARDAFVAALENDLTPVDKDTISSRLPGNKAYSAEFLNDLLEVAPLVLINMHRPIEDQWRNIVVDRNFNPPTSKFLQDVFDRILRSGNLLVKVVELNQKVHFDTYNEMIRSEGKRIFELRD
ncbi:hypothetical protein GUITHDRAFT_122397 [Guillardia theta CCMP2712]|uniref:Uncharacterized protein n=1 Tax=Guillardia theta (strain CCMP2712) TaxID=905079 RepID=L1I569_GUITC|nr:hypothetical protein GUITHDRAFT_122397 [Guillardia theta CCMP2712]EKX31408.1 hypothetical protein GUITHDRAFT_122397 [Guillardia theta CCMP2712]|eukprot:XP_005818388.1 hypothetical protein GUITHDRAFT_122397 [Guillardia theta CCMP2712]